MISSQSERAVLGCMLYETRPIDEFVRAGGDVTWFADEYARRTASAALALHADGRPVDLLLVRERDPGIPAEFVERCLDDAVTPAHSGAYIEQLRCEVILHNAKEVADAGLDRLRDALPHEAEGAVNEIIASLRRIATGHTDDELPIADCAHAVIDEWAAPDRDERLLPWPVDKITQTMGGIDDELIWLIAQPSIGKTAFALQACIVAGERGKPTAVASLESSRQRVAGRLIASLGGVDTLRLRRGMGTSAEMQAARDAADRLRTLPIRVTDAGMTLEQVYAWGRAKADAGARLLVIDNTRHIRNGNSRESRVEFMGEISARLKQLRDDAGVPVMVLHHATRPDDKGRDDISWSSDIRRDADCVVFLREDADRSVAPSGPGDAGVTCVGLDVEKHRDGMRGLRVRMEFEKWRQRFVAWREQ